MRNKRVLFLLGMGLLLLAIATSGCIAGFWQPPSLVSGGAGKWIHVRLVSNGSGDAVPVVWVMIPNEWGVVAVQYYGDYGSGNFSRDTAAETHIENNVDCSGAGNEYGGTPKSGYKWRAYAGPTITWDPAKSLRVKIGVKASASATTGPIWYRVVTGIGTYSCYSMIETSLSVQ
jgi:hypothetical protein